MHYKQINSYEYFIEIKYLLPRFSELNTSFKIVHKNQLKYIAYLYLEGKFRIFILFRFDVQMIDWLMVKSVYIKYIDLFLSVLNEISYSKVDIYV